MKTRTPIKTYWRYANEGIQLSAPLWWAGYISPSEKQPGKWWWKATAVKGQSSSFSGYADTPEEAVANVYNALREDDLYEYELPPESKALELLSFLTKRAQKE